ncbi:peptidase [Pandoraea pnomenusa]|nr:peptidase [Pandoraea pnomenusa]
MTSEDYSGVDVGGNPYGTQLDSRQPWSAPFGDVM